MGWERAANQVRQSAQADEAKSASPAQNGPVDLRRLAAVGGNAAFGRLLRSMGTSQGSDAPIAPEGFGQRLGGAGHGIPEASKSQLESGLGVSLDGVRLHTDGTAADLAADVNARAFTVGSDIYFGAGRYRPASSDGYRLLAHEVAHTVQQSGTAAAPAASPLSISEPDSTEERDAEQVADRLAAGVSGPMPASVSASAAAASDADPALAATPAANGGGAAVQRDLDPASFPPFTPADPSTLVCTAEEAQLSSPHPEVDGKTVHEVGADLGARDARYRHAIDQMRAGSVSMQHTEQDWYDNLGLIGGFVDWFNSAPKTDPARWQDVLQRWDAAASAFDAILVQPISPTTISAAGDASSNAMNLLSEAYELSMTDSAQFETYLVGFQHSAQGVITVATVARDVGFAIAVGAAVVVAAPVVATALAGAGAGTALTYGGTALAMGVMGAGIEGGGQALATLSTQAAAALADLWRGSEHAADNFDLDEVFGQGWDGMKRGFIDGVLAFAGMEAEKALAGAVGPAIRSVLGPGNSSLMAMVVRRALTRAISGGSTGAVIGALQAGLRAALNGQDLSGIASAMEQGFLVGGAAGTLFGAVGGAVEARGAFQLRQAVLPELQQGVLANYGPEIDQRMFDNLQQKLLANPGKGTNDQLAAVLPDISAALRDPERIADVLADIWLEEQLLGVMAPRDAAARYGEAAMALSRRAGAPVVVLQPGQTFSAQEFFDQVVVSGNRFLDLAILETDPQHGATTHLIQDLVADRMLTGTGLRAEQVRALFAGAVDAEGLPIGNDLWITIYDALPGGLNQPEVVYPIMARALGGLK